ncbi:unnamed protein product, partial [Brenthis ino]
MKLFWCYVTAALLTITQAAVDVEKTVQQVQSILKANTLLPRLTRDEIIQLLNDIRSEDAKSKSESKEKSNEIKNTTIGALKENLKDDTTTLKYKNLEDNEIATQLYHASLNNDKNSIAETTERNVIESTTKSSGQTLTVVLPYTPRDGSSLQELYTKPPRLQVVTESVTPKPIKTSKSKVQTNQLVKNKNTKTPKLDLPAELQAFLEAHGLKGNPGQDNFLLPLEGFKPLPAPKLVDGSIQLPENLLLTYDLISPSDLSTSRNKDQNLAQTNFLYEPLKPQFPFELDTSSSETKHSVLPLDLPKPRKPKAVSSTPKPNYEPIDYEAVKVIPLNQGPNPADDEVLVGVEQNKRQTNETASLVVANSTSTESTSQQTETKNAEVPDNIPSDTDAGASIADLEDSFGGAAPVVPGDSELPPPKKNGFYWMADWNSFLEVGDGDTKVNIRFEPKFGDPQMFLPVNVP